MRSSELKAYLHGAAHDGTLHVRHKTFRFSQKEREWLEYLQSLLIELGCKAWLYREGQTRNVFVLETTADFLQKYRPPQLFKTRAEKIAYIRGYFDAEGGIPSQIANRFYVQFVQKNADELLEIQHMLNSLGIETGKLHIPSKRVDPNYFRFFVSTSSHQHFIQTIGSWHPRKEPLLSERMKI
jgi:intein-encoded DNA endonuclease-like protein